MPLQNLEVRTTDSDLTSFGNVHLIRLLFLRFRQLEPVSKNAVIVVNPFPSNTTLINDAVSSFPRNQKKKEKEKSLKIRTIYWLLQKTCLSL